jgi:hypothetical protein
MLMPLSVQFEVERVEGSSQLDQLGILLRETFMELVS